MDHASIINNTAQSYEVHLRSAMVKCAKLSGKGGVEAHGMAICLANLLAENLATIEASRFNSPKPEVRSAPQQFTSWILAQVVAKIKTKVAGGHVQETFTVTHQ